MHRSNRRKMPLSMETLESRRVFAANPLAGAQLAADAPAEVDVVATVGGTWAAQPAASTELQTIVRESAAHESNLPAGVDATPHDLLYAEGTGAPNGTTLSHQSSGAEGDSDNPVITGRIFDGESVPPFGLPGSQQVSGMKSQSTLGGSGDSPISESDPHGGELIRIHAQYDMGTTVEHDDSAHDSASRGRELAIDKVFAGESSAMQASDPNEVHTIGAAQSITVGGFL